MHVPLLVVPSTINEESIIASNLANRVCKVIYFILLLYPVVFPGVFRVPPWDI
jgi:hypothetical protein